MKCVMYVDTCLMESWLLAAANNVSYNQWYFVILLACFPLSGKITETMRAIFPCYRDQKKWIKGKFCQPKAEGRGLVMFPRFTFSDRDNIGNVFEHFKIDLSSGWNRKNNITECFFAFILTFLRWLGKKAWQKSYKN